MVARTANDFAGGPPLYSGNAPNYNSTTPGLTTLVSIRLKVGGSNLDPNVALYSSLPDNVVTPDQIELAGNFTTSDEYTANIDQPPGGGTGNCNGARIHLDPKDPATIRFVDNPRWHPLTQNAVDATFAVFFPGDERQCTRLINSGCASRTTTRRIYQFVAICDKVDSIGTELLADGTTGIYIDTLTLLMTNDQGTGGIVPGRGAGSNVVVSPLQVVRWEVMRRANNILDAPAVPVEALNACALRADSHVGSAFECAVRERTLPPCLHVPTPAPRDGGGVRRRLEVPGSPFTIPRFQVCVTSISTTPSTMPRGRSPRHSARRRWDRPSSSA